MVGGVWISPPEEFLENNADRASRRGEKLYPTRADHVGTYALMFAEPPRTRFDLHFNVAGFPVRVCPWFWLTGLLLGLAGQRGNSDPALVLIFIVTVFVSILVHELGHAFAIRHFGGRSRIILYQLGGLATIDDQDSYLSGYQEQERGPKAMILIALAGPVAGFLLAALLILVLFISPIGFHFNLSNPVTGVGWDMQNLPPRVKALIGNMLFINILWGLVNLLPVYPLDGGQVARELLSTRSPRQGIERSLQLSAITGGVVAALGLFHFFRLKDYSSGLLMGVMFGLLAFNSYRALQMIRAHGGFGGGYGGGSGRGHEADDDDWWKR